MPLLQSTGFATAVIDALALHICVLDRRGTIIAVNRAWREFARENDSPTHGEDVGIQYLKICRDAVGAGSDEADAFGRGVQAVLEGEANLFEMEYPCDSPSEARWFIGSTTPLKMEEGGAVISHMNITEQKLLEFNLARLAATDTLTGLPNRRNFLETASRELARLKRFGKPASLVAIDIDHFKYVNDLHGHAGGDEALRSFSGVGRAAIRKSDLLARFGGEEFMLLLPDTTSADAACLAEKLRTTVAETPVHHGAKSFRITASFGVTEITDRDEDTADALLRADLALYAAKNAGRNCIRTYASTQAPA